jgi:hypothetical protein
MPYQTTVAIKSLAKNGVNLGARQPVTPQAFTPEHWQRLLLEGAIIEVDEAPETAVPSFVDMDIDELKAAADDKGVAYTWNIKRETLIERLKNA